MRLFIGVKLNMCSYRMLQVTVDYFATFLRIGNIKNNFFHAHESDNLYCASIALDKKWYFSEYFIWWEAHDLMLEI